MKFEQNLSQMFFWPKMAPPLDFQKIEATY